MSDRLSYDQQTKMWDAGSELRRPKGPGILRGIKKLFDPIWASAKEGTLFGDGGDGAGDRVPDERKFAGEVLGEQESFQVGQSPEADEAVRVVLKSLGFDSGDLEADFQEFQAMLKEGHYSDLESAMDRDRVGDSSVSISGGMANMLKGWR